MYRRLYPSRYESRLYPSQYKKDEDDNNKMLIMVWLEVWLEAIDKLRSISRSRDY